MFSERKELLLRMLKIEEEVKAIEFRSDFRKIRSNLKMLESANSGKPRISVEYPDDLDRMVEFRKNSKDIEPLIIRYKERLHEFESKLNVLNDEKAVIKKQLFP